MTSDDLLRFALFLGVFALGLHGAGLFLMTPPGRWLRDLALDVRNGFKAARRQRKMIADARAADERYRANRPTIARVGTVERDACGNFVLNNDWQFHLKVEHCPYPVVRFDIDGTWRAFGYTQRELEEIHARRDEWDN